MRSDEALELVRTLARMNRELSASPSGRQALQAIAEGAAHTVRGATSAGIAVVDGTGVVESAAGSTRAARSTSSCTSHRG